MDTSEIESGSSEEVQTAGAITWQEIQQQPILWLTTSLRVRERMGALELSAGLKNARVILSGAGTSAYAATAVAAAWPRSRAVPSTDLLLATENYIEDADVVISLARSGNSPES